MISLFNKYKRAFQKMLSKILMVNDMQQLALYIGYG